MTNDTPREMSDSEVQAMLNPEITETPIGSPREMSADEVNSMLNPETQSEDIYQFGVAPTGMTQQEYHSKQIGLRTPDTEGKGTMDLLSEALPQAGEDIANIYKSGLANVGALGAAGVANIAEGLDLDSTWSRDTQKYLQEVANEADKELDYTYGDMPVVKELLKVAANPLNTLKTAQGALGYAQMGGIGAAEKAGDIALKGDMSGATMEDVGDVLTTGALTAAGGKLLDTAVEKGAQGVQAVKKMNDDRLSNKLKEISDIKEDPTNVDLITKKIVKDKNGKEIVTTDIDAVEGVKHFGNDISIAKNATNDEKVLMNQMTDIMERGLKDPKFADNYTPGFIVGKEMANNIKHIVKKNTEDTKKLNTIAKNLHGKSIDLTRQQNIFNKTMRKNKIDIKVDKSGNVDINLDNSPFAGSKPTNEILGIVFKRLNKITDARQAHEFKKLLDSKIKWGKNLADPVDTKVQSILKDLRSDIDNALDSKFTRYKEVNDSLHEGISAYSKFQDASKFKMDWDDDALGDELGTIARKLTGNAQSRATLKDAMAKLQEVAKKKGYDKNVDIENLNMFANMFEIKFGSQRKTSFQGQVQQGTAQAAADIAMSGDPSTGIIRAGFKKLTEPNKKKANAKAIKSLRKILSKEGTTIDTKKRVQKIMDEILEDNQ